MQPTWTYDAFGNRLTEQEGAVPGATPQALMPTSSTNYYTTASNQLSSSTLASSITYDAAGDVTYDGTNYYLYDAEGRICAVKNSNNAMTGYIYDASGIRVAKGSLTSFSCNFASNGYSTTSSYVLGPGGEQVTEYSVSGGASTWVHTNVFSGGTLLASYHDTDTYFALNDWLGTKRAEISAGGKIANYRSLPYGNGLTSSGTAPDATEQHFTGKERDTESGNDYFDARYYGSSMGRFLSPDDGSDQDPSDPQSWNLYSYVQNNPLTNTDPDGHACTTTTTVQSFNGEVVSSSTTKDCSGGLNALEQNFYNAAKQGISNAADAASQFGHQFMNIMNTPGGVGCLAGATVGGAMTGSAGGAAAGLVGLAGGPAVVVTEPSAIAVGGVGGGASGFMLGMIGCPGGAASGGGGSGGGEDGSGKQGKFWKSLKNYRDNIKTNGLSGKAKRFFQWDYTHGDVEVYDGRGNHLGSADPVTGEMTKPAVAGRKLNL